MPPKIFQTKMGSAAFLLLIWLAAIIAVLTVTSATGQGYGFLVFMIWPATILLATVIALYLTKKFANRLTPNRVAARSQFILALVLMIGLAAGLYTWGAAHGSEHHSLILPLILVSIFNLIIYFSTNQYIIFSTNTIRRRVWLMIAVLSLLLLPSLVCYKMSGSKNNIYSQIQ